MAGAQTAHGEDVRDDMMTNGPELAAPAGDEGSAGLGGEPLTRESFAPAAGHTGPLHSGVVVSALGFGLFMAWIYVVCFSTKLFPPEWTTAAMAPAGELASFVGYLAWIGFCVITYRRLVDRWGRRVMVFAALCALGTAGVSVASVVIDAQLAFGLVCGSSLLAGACSGCLLVAWALQYVRGAGRNAVAQVGGGLVVSFAVTSVTLLLPFELAAAVAVLLPVGCGAAIVRGGDLADAHPVEAPAPPADARECRMPWQLVVGLSAMGLVHGLTYGFAFEYAQQGIEVSFACLLVNGLVGAGVLWYAVRCGKNFGYSVATVAILPIAGFGQCMVAVLATDLLPVSFFVIRLAYILFDVTLWLQLPKVFARVGTVRTFLVSRLVLEGASAAGVVGRELLTLTGFQVFDAVTLAVMGYLLLALTIAFSGGRAGRVWDLMPAPTVRTHKFARACERIAAEHGLTPREAEVMRLVMRGRSGTFVQEDLFISKSTFQTHMRNLYHKLDVHSNQELIDVLERTLEEDNDPALRA